MLSQTYNSENNLPSFTFRYFATGSTDIYQVQLEAGQYLNATYLNLPRQRVTVEPIFVDTVRAVGRWKVEIIYGVQAQSIDGGTGLPVPEISFSTMGGTQHVTQSLSTVNRYAPSGQTAPNFKGAIGVTDKSVEGTDIPVSVFNFQETHYFSTFTEANKATLAYLTAKWNNAVWRTFAIGEVLFLGVEGGRRGSAPWALTFHFAVSQNKTNLAVGDITVSTKMGWDYVWTQYEAGVDNTAHAYVRIPKSCHVERVLEGGDFSGLGIS
jgi:hypothetical protein